MIPASGGDSERETAGRRWGRSSSLPVLIIGGGIAGCSLAYSLARGGVEVRLLERGRIGEQGASAVAAALLNPFRGRSARPGPFDLDGLQAFWRLAQALTGDGHHHGAERSGVLRVANGTRQARSWRQLPGLLPLASVPAPYRAPHGAFLVPDGGWVDSRRLLSALVAGARARGAVFSQECAVEAVERQRGGWLVHTENETLTARRVALCLGSGTVAGAQLPELERVAGDQVTLGSELAIPYPVAGSVYLASTVDKVLVGGNHREPERSDPEAPELLRASASRVIPELAAAPIEGVWTGVRARQPGNVPLVSELAPGLWFLGAFGGRGFLTAPLLAERLAAVLDA